MTRLPLLITIQALFSALSGYLFSSMSFIGRMSINIAFREYAILKVWWKTALLLFVLQLLLIFILWAVHKFIGSTISAVMAAFFLIIACIGIYYTYLDFTSTTHKLMKFYFHAGGYLFWVAWACTCLYFLFIKRNAVQPPAVESNLVANHMQP